MPLSGATPRKFEPLIKYGCVPLAVERTAWVKVPNHNTMIKTLNSILASLDPTILKTSKVGGELFGIKAFFDINDEHRVVLNVYEDADNHIIFELWSSLQELHEDGIWFDASETDVVETTKRFIRNVTILVR